MSRSGAIRDIQGQRFGREKEIEAVQFIGVSLYGDSKGAEWLMKCHRCGETFGKHLRNLRTAQSCGSNTCRKYYSRKRRGIQVA